MAVEALRHPVGSTPEVLRPPLVRNRFESHGPDVWVGTTLFPCYEEVNPRAAVAPDVMLARGIEVARLRRELEGR